LLGGKGARKDFNGIDGKYSLVSLIYGVKVWSMGFPPCSANIRTMIPKNRDSSAMDYFCQLYMVPVSLWCSRIACLKGVEL